MSKAPEISIIIPTYNAAQFLPEAIRSVFDQTDQDFELIVVNDGSTDNTKALLSAYGDRILVIDQINRGAASARNAGILASQGRWISFLDADDVWIPQKLEWQAPLLQNPVVGLVYGDCYYWNGAKTEATTSFCLYPPYRGNIFDRYLVQNFIPMSTVLVRRTWLEKTGLFDENMDSCEDYEFLLRVCKIGETEYVNRPVMKYRIRPGQQSKNVEKNILNTLKIKEKIFSAQPELITRLGKPSLDRGFYNLYLKLAKVYIQNANVPQARQTLQKYWLMRGKTPLSLGIFLACYLHNGTVRFLLRSFDRVHYRSEYGQF
jgi:glycosyltransferase involved in cell wall biosynthesis